MWPCLVGCSKREMTNTEPSFVLYEHILLTVRGSWTEMRWTSNLKDLKNMKRTSIKVQEWMLVLVTAAHQRPDHHQSKPQYADITFTYQFMSCLCMFAHNMILSWREKRFRNRKFLKDTGSNACPQVKHQKLSFATFTFIAKNSFFQFWLAHQCNPRNK